MKYGERKLMNMDEVEMELYSSANHIRLALEKMGMSYDQACREIEKIDKSGKWEDIIEQFIRRDITIVMNPERHKNFLLAIIKDKLNNFMATRKFFLEDIDIKAYRAEDRKRLKAFKYKYKTLNTDIFNPKSNSKKDTLEEILGAVSTTVFSKESLH